MFFSFLKLVITSCDGRQIDFLPLYTTNIIGSFLKCKEKFTKSYRILTKVTPKGQKADHFKEK